MLDRYQPRPNARHREAGNGELIKAWQDAMAARRTELETLRHAAQTEAAAISGY